MFRTLDLGKGRFCCILRKIIKHFNTLKPYGLVVN